MTSKEDILRLWHKDCHICGAPLGDNKHLQESIVQLEVTPKDAEAYYTQYYVVCQECKDIGELI